MSASDDRIVEYIANEKSRSQLSIRQYYEPEWEENIDCYMNHRRTDMPPGAEWVRDEQIADGYRTVEAAVPQLVMGTYQNPRWFTVEAPTVPGQTFQEMWHSALTASHKQAQYMMRSIPEIRMQIILGHMIQKTYYTIEVGTEQVRTKLNQVNAFGEPIQEDFITEEEIVNYEGTWCEWPDLKTIWKSVEIDRFGRHTWYLESRDTTFDILKYEDDQYKAVGGLYEPATLKKLKQTISTRPTSRHNGLYDNLAAQGFSMGDPFDFDTIQDDISGISRSMRQGENAVTIWEFWGYIPPQIKKYSDTQWRLVEIANGTYKLRDVPAPTYDHRPPYDDVYGTRVGKEPYGRSFLRWIYPEIEQMSTFRNLRQASAMLELFPPTLADADVDFESEEFNRVPAGIWWVHNAGQGLGNVFAQTPRHPVMPEAYRETSIMEDHILKTSGSTEPFQGSFAPGGSHRTLGEFQGTVGLGQGRHRVQVMQADHQAKLPFLRRTFKELQLNQPEMVVEIAESNGVRGDAMFDLKWDVDIQVHSAEFGNLDSSRLNSLVALLGAFAQTPELSRALKSTQIVRDAFYYSGFPRAAKYVRTEDELAQMAQQEQELQLLQSALAGGGSNNQVESGGGTSGGGNRAQGRATAEASRS